MDTALQTVLKQLDRYQVVSLCEKEQSVFLYGTGSFARSSRRALQNIGILISGFIDHRAVERKQLDGLPLYQPDNLSINPNQVVVILAVHNREADILNIQTTLQNLGYQKILSPIDLYDHLANELGTRYWLTSRTYYANFLAEINETYNLLVDEQSHQTFSSIMRFRITGDYSVLPAPDFKHQYFAPDLPQWEQPIRLIDCGAYDGDAIRDFIGAGFEFQAVAAFEPDANNFQKLAQSCRVSLANISEVSLYPCGVHSTTTQLRFQSGQGEASALADSGDTVIQCVALDEALPNFKPTLIKMDIEGAELDALIGASQLVTKYQPGLAISIYHTPAHIWEIPVYISNLAKRNNLHYTYHLRAHANNCFDTIFYAIPKG